MLYKVFDEYAERYDSWYRKNPILFECEARVIRQLKLHGKGLSVGVGTGTLDSQAPVDVGIDPSVNMLRFAATYGIKLVRAVGEYLPFKDETFDFTLMTATMCFLKSPEKAIWEIRRVLRRHGEIAICIVPRNSRWGEKYMEKAKKGHIFYKHAHFYTLGEVKQLLKKCFFRVIAVKSALSYSPHDKPRIEEPLKDPEGKGFVCIKAVKI